MFAAVAVIALVAMPAISWAASNAINSNVWNLSILKGPLVTCTGDGSGGFPPCENLCDLVSTVANVAYFFIAVVIWIFMPIMFAWSGLSLMLSQGNSEGMSKAKKRLTGSAIGLLVALGAYLIVFIFVHVLGFATFIGGFGAATCPLQG